MNTGIEDLRHPIELARSSLLILLGSCACELAPLLVTEECPTQGELPEQGMQRDVRARTLQYLDWALSNLREERAEEGIGFPHGGEKTSHKHGQDGAEVES